MTDAPNDRTSEARPAWVPIALVCMDCNYEWDGWQPWGVPVDTCVAHLNTYRCPHCGVDARRILLRNKMSDLAGAEMTEHGSIGSGGAATKQNRLVLTDDGTRILLTVYPASTRLPGMPWPPPLAVELSPERAVRLCAELSEAAARHLGRRSEP